MAHRWRFICRAPCCRRFKRRWVERLPPYSQALCRNAFSRVSNAEYCVRSISASWCSRNASIIAIAPCCVVGTVASRSHHEFQQALAKPQSIGIICGAYVRGDPFAGDVIGRVDAATFTMDSFALCDPFAPSAKQENEACEPPNFARAPSKQATHATDFAEHSPQARGTDRDHRQAAEPLQWS